MRKSWMVLIVSLLALCLTTPALAKPLNLGVAWVGKSGMANRVMAGLEAQLKEIAPEAKLEVSPDMASMDDMAKVVAKFQSEKDGMIILRSNGAKWLASNLPNIPTFIGGCNNPAELGAVKNLQSPEGKITGVTYFLPAETQFESFKAILPQMKKVMLLMEKGHPSSAIDEEGTKAACAKFGVEYSGSLSGSKEEILATVKANSGQVSAFIIGNQGLILDSSADIVAAAAKTPVLAYNSQPVTKGALGGMVADDNRLGRMLAESVAEVLIKGKAVKDVPVRMDPKPTFYVNAKTAEKIGVEIPYSVLEAAKVIE